MEINFSSESINELASALSNFQGQIKQPNFNKLVSYVSAKGSKKFRYADLAECLRSAQTPLADNGLCVTQIVAGNNLITQLMHKSGQFVRSIIPIALAQGSMQDFGSMLTYLKRYSYCAILGIAADDDDDANGYDKTGLVPEDIRRPEPKPQKKASPPKAPITAKEAEDAVADAVIKRTYEQDVQVAIGMVMTAPSKEAVKGIFNSVPEEVQKNQELREAIKKRYKELE